MNTIWNLTELSREANGPFQYSNQALLTIVATTKIPYFKVGQDILLMGKDLLNLIEILKEQKEEIYGTLKKS